MEILSRTLFLFLLIAFPTFMITFRGTPGLAFADDDIAEGEEDPVDDGADEGADDGADDAVDEDEVEEDDEATVEEDDEGKGTTDVTTEEGEDEAEVDDGAIKSSPDADVTVLFVKPGPNPSSIFAGKMVRCLIGFTNKGSNDFTLETVDASFRYPQEFSYYMQNFTTVKYDRLVEPKYQATIDYAFTPDEAFAGRPFGLVINLNYKDADGNVWQNAVFNETITVDEFDEGLDGETFFLYLFLVAMVVLLLIAGQQFLGSFTKKHLGSGSSATKLKASVEPGMEMGTQNGGLMANGDIDMSWIPSQNLVHLSNSGSPKQSPRQRKAKRRDD